MAKTKIDKLEEEQFIRGWKLLQAYRAGKSVTIDGVTIDYSCGLDWTEWQPLCPIGFHSNAAAIHGPEVVFPWTPAYFRDLWAQTLPVVEAAPGCVVSIRQTTSAPITTPFRDFDHPDQREHMRVYLNVTMRDGTTFQVQRPMLLLKQGATDAHIAMEDYGAAFRGLVGKLESALGINDLEEMVEKPVEDWSTPSHEASVLHKRALLVLADATTKYDEHAYVAFGYLMARAEAQELLLAPAERGRRASEVQAGATKARMEKSLQTSRILQACAREIIEAEGDISRGRCAKLVAERMATDATWTFSTDTKWIADHISDLFERRGSRLEYRPKRDLMARGDDH